MDPFETLLLACRTGDVDTVDLLTVSYTPDINRTDSWNYLPLILASLCGHLSVVKLLLSRGAVCDRDTFQGTRCLYGALTDEIKAVLLEYDITKAVDEAQPFLAHMARLLAGVNEKKDTGSSSRRSEGCGDNKNAADVSDVLLGDLAVVFPNRVFSLHRFVLAARSEYFSRKLAPGGPWHRKVAVTMPAVADCDAFAAIVSYIYLLPWPHNILLKQLQQFAKKLGLSELKEAIQNEYDNFGQSSSILGQKLLEYSSSFADEARGDMSHFVDTHVLGGAVEVELHDDTAFEDVNAPLLLPEHVRSALLGCATHADAIMSSIDVELGAVVYYPVHRAVLVRSEYYRTMFEDWGARFPTVYVHSLEEDQSGLSALNDVLGTVLMDSNTIFLDTDERILTNMSTPGVFSMLSSVLSSVLSIGGESSLSTSSSRPKADSGSSASSRPPVSSRLVCRPEVTPSHVPVLQAPLSTTSRVATDAILRFLYCDDAGTILPQVAVELLLAADELWLDRLKTFAALALTPTNFDRETLDSLPETTGLDVCDLVEIAWRTHCDRLEHHMTKLIAHNIRYMCGNSELRKRLLGLIAASAADIRVREETDTIGVVDDIRYYLGKKYRAYDDYAELEGLVEGEDDVNVAEIDHDYDCALIDGLLDELHLEA